MSREAVAAICATLPGSECTDPWGGGHECWKVGGKMYAVTGAMNAGVTLKVADAETAALLVELGRAERAPYLPRGGWVLVPWGRMEAEELAGRIRTSYALVRAGLPRRVRAALGPGPRD